MGGAGPGIAQGGHGLHHSRRDGAGSASQRLLLRTRHEGSPSVLFIDLTNTRVAGATRIQQWDNPVLAGYKLVSYQDASSQPIVRVLVDEKQPQPFSVKRDNAGLHLIYSTTAATQPEAVPAAPKTPSAPATRPQPAAKAENAPVTTGESAVISNLAIDKQDSGQTFVDVATSATASYRVITLPNPLRLVVDIDGVKTPSVQKNYSVETPVLKDVRVGQFHANNPSVVRVVADLTGNPVFDVHATPQGLRIELRPRGTETSAAIARREPAPAAAPKATKPVVAEVVIPAAAKTTEPKREVVVAALEAPKPVLISANEIAPRIDAAPAPAAAAPSVEVAKRLRPRSRPKLRRRNHLPPRRSKPRPAKT